MRKLILFITLALFSANLFAQQECAFVLQEAQELFDAGLIETIPDQLTGCLKTGFTNEEQLQAYKLIILSYLFDDNIEKADEFMLKFLSEYPSYEPVATDPREFIVLLETYDTNPVLMIGGGAGVNFSFPIVTEPFGVHDVLQQPGRMVPGRTGFHGSFMVERQIIPHLQILGEIAVANIVYDNNINYENDLANSSFQVTDFSIIEYNESQVQVRLPVSATWYFSDTDFKPFVRAGIVPSLLVAATGNAVRDYPRKINYDPVSVSNVDILPGRRMFNMWIFAGGGFSYKLGPGNIFLDLRYHMNILNQVKPGSDPFLSQQLTWEVFMVRDQFLLNNLSLSVGYMFPLYRPKKIEQQ